MRKERGRTRARQKKRGGEEGEREEGRAERREGIRKERGRKERGRNGETEEERV